jgi:hypothetical protein
VSLEGELLGIAPEGATFLLTPAVLFRTEVGVGDDAPGLCGKVKTLAAVEALAGEHAPGSVVLGDHAYEVLDGFVGDLIETGHDGAVALAELSALAVAHPLRSARA